jgi:hypothetical protein
MTRLSAAGDPAATVHVVVAFESDRCFEVRRWGVGHRGFLWCSVVTEGLDAQGYVIGSDGSHAITVIGPKRSWQISGRSVEGWSASLAYGRKRGE